MNALVVLTSLTLRAAGWSLTSSTDPPADQASTSSNVTSRFV